MGKEIRPNDLQKNHTTLEKKRVSPVWYRETTRVCDNYLGTILLGGSLLSDSLLGGSDLLGLLLLGLLLLLDLLLLGLLLGELDGSGLALGLGEVTGLDTALDGSVEMLVRVVTNLVVAADVLLQSLAG